MKSFGEVIKQARFDKQMSFADLARSTKIKVDFLKSIENQKWDALPEYPVLQGFVRSVANSLGFDAVKMLAILRRDYPPKKLNVIPKPDVEDTVNRLPKLSVLMPVLLVVLAIISYLGYQYIRFVSPPSLRVDFPSENYVVEDSFVEVYGSTSQDSTITVNNQPIVVSPQGNFSGGVEVTPDTASLEIKSVSRSGRETTLTRKIQVK